MQIKFPQCKRTLFAKVMRVDDPWQSFNHEHDYWEVEYVYKGAYGAFVNEREMVVRENELIIIPPFTKHKPWMSRDSIVHTLCFETFLVEKNLSPMAIRELELYRGIYSVINNLTEKGFPTELASSMLESICNLFISHYYFNAEKEFHNENSLVYKIKKAIHDDVNQKMNIAQISKKLGFSGQYLSHIFREKTGIKLKTYLDQKRAKNALHYLEYSGMPIKAIAKQLEFSDVYSFSRFLKRTLDIRPKEVVHKRI